MKSMSITGLRIGNVGDKIYRIIFSLITFDEAVNLLNNSNIIDKKGVL